MSRPINIGKRIKKFREQRGISVHKLARLVGMAHTSLSRYENSDKNHMKASYLIKIAKVLDIDVKKFF